MLSSSLAVKKGEFFIDNKRQICSHVKANSLTKSARWATLQARRSFFCVLKTFRDSIAMKMEKKLKSIFYVSPTFNKANMPRRSRSIIFREIAEKSA